MRYRTLGRTGLRVSEIGLGTSLTFREAASADPARCGAVVRAALDRGVNFFDTAPVYGESERVLGRALAGVRKDIFLATKVWESTPGAARASVERSLERLRTDAIDLLQIHNMAGWREVTPALIALREESKVRFLGVTERKPENYPEVAEALRTGAYDAVQIPYYLGETSCREAILPLARELNLGVIVMRPLSRLISRRSLLRTPGARGALRAAASPLGPKRLLGAGAEEALAFLRPHGAATPGQALLKYLLADPAVSTVIPATAWPGRMAENAAASDGHPLPPEACERLEGLLR